MNRQIMLRRIFLNDRTSGLRLVLTVNPFVSTESSSFGSAVDDAIFVRERNSTRDNVPALTWFKVGDAFKS